MYKLQFGEKWSNLLVAIYLLATMYIRFLVEPQLKGNFLVSVALGALALLFLWALMKSKILNPSFWGKGRND